MNGWLLDVNVLLGCGWKNHAGHPALLDWLLQTSAWATCPLTKSGFMRISMTTAYQAAFEDARKSLATLRALPGHRFVIDDVDAASLPTLTSFKDTTDAHLVTLGPWSAPTRGTERGSRSPMLFNGPFQWTSDYSTGRGETARAEAGHSG